MKRTAFFISDSTGITAETLGVSLLAQFEELQCERIVIPYVDTLPRAEQVVAQIDRAAEEDGLPPIVFDTIVNREVRACIAKSKGVLLDVFSSFLTQLEQVLGLQSHLTVGRGHHISTTDHKYRNRIDAVHYAMENDDGARIDRYEQAQLILIGPSRSGKTPTCLYLALQSGIYAANYPLTEEDLEQARLPKALEPHRDKLFGLTILPERLSAIRNERRNNSRYASLTRCEDEIRQAEAMYSRFKIPKIETTDLSVEEIATRILLSAGLRGNR